MASICICLQTYTTAQTNGLKSPSEFLPYVHGTRFTPHHLLVDYFKHVSSVSPNIKLIEYGQTYELRPLIAAIISSPENMNQLEALRQNNLRRTGMVKGEITQNNIAVVYLSYSVHGNEAAGSESSMQVLYELALGGTEINKWLSNTIVIIDPALNPDGFSRFSNWSNMVSNVSIDPHRETREHQEPWPGGRVNHYYFDLNRDWAWQTQKESRDRVAFYMQWMPQVHVDLHEMGPESPYFFAPAAQPYHPYITSWQATFMNTIGKNHASYFDKEGWRYYTKEGFDLFYPSYGDTYPSFSGAIGMTYEQGGSGVSNRAILLANGDTLTLADRIAHHRTTSLSTIETCSKHAKELVSAFDLYFKNSVSNPPGEFKSYVIKSSNQSGRILDLTTLLDRQGIKYGVMPDDGKTIKGFNYLSGESISFVPLKGDLIIPASQPRSVLLQALFEPEALLVDSVTYDITAWSVPMAFGLDAYGTTEKLDFTTYTPLKKNTIPDQSKPYAYAIEWGSVPSTQLVSSLLADGIVARYTTSEFKINDITYPTGTILLMRADNRKLETFDQLVSIAAAKSVVRVSLINSGFVQSGKDLGSNDFPLVRKPKVISFAGEGVSVQSIGQIWHFFEEELNYPIHLVVPDQIKNVDLDDYNVVVLPEGFYTLDTDVINKLKLWVSSGGKLIALGTGIRQLAGKEGFAIKSLTKEEAKNGTDPEPAHYPEAYASTRRKSVSEDIGGAVFQTKMDRTNPLAFGLGEFYLTLKTSPSAYAWLPAEGNAIFLDKNPTYYGFAGHKALEKINKSLVAGLESMGKGSVVYMVDNPLFRSFWNSGKVLFSNALFF